MRMSGTKRCSRCDEEKQVLAFAGNKTNPDGLARWCRQCSAKHGAGRRLAKRRLFAVDPYDSFLFSPRGRE